jgi:hypothetical protein
LREVQAGTRRRKKASKASPQKQIAPAKYNTASELTLDVGEAEIQKDWPLTL